MTRSVYHVRVLLIIVAFLLRFLRLKFRDCARVVLLVTSSPLACAFNWTRSLLLLSLHVVLISILKSFLNLISWFWKLILFKVSAQYSLGFLLDILF